LIYGAHAAITAEGDSAVLMQKVSKEYVEDFLKNLVSPPALTEKIETLKEKSDIFNTHCLLDLIRFRETSLLKALADKTVNNITNIYEQWMFKESDLIQDLAMTYGERICLEETLVKMGSLE
jgi:acyl-CoA oxidase